MVARRCRLDVSESEPFKMSGVDCGIHGHPIEAPLGWIPEVWLDIGFDGNLQSERYGLMKS